MSRIFTFEIPPSHPWNDIHTQLLWVYHGTVILSARRDKVAGTLGSLTVLEGRLQVERKGLQIEALPGQTLLFPAGGRILMADKETRALSVGCFARWPDQTELFAFREPFLVRGSDSRAIERRANRLLQAVHGSQAEISWFDAMKFQPVSLTHHTTVQSALWSWLEPVAEILHRKHITEDVLEHRDARAHTLARRLNELPLDRRFSSAILSEGLGLSWRRLEQLFKETSGVSPSEYHERRRVSAARQFVSATSLSMKEISAALGFSSQAHFSRWFHGHFGKSPSEYVREGRKG